MYKTVTKTVAGATSCSAVGRETTQKSRVSTRKTRGVGKNLLATLLLIAFCAFANKANAAVTITSPSNMSTHTAGNAINVAWTGTNTAYLVGKILTGYPAPTSEDEAGDEYILDADVIGNSHSFSLNDKWTNAIGHYIKIFVGGAENEGNDKIYVLIAPPAPTTNDATAITATSAKLSGSSSYADNSGIQYRTVGGAWSANLSAGTITGLQPSTTYEFRYWAAYSGPYIGSNSTMYGATKTFTTQTEDILKTGTCGVNLTWKLTGTTDNSTLTISGTGAMYDYGTSSSTRAPWYSDVNGIKTIAINDGTTSIGAYAFNNCVSLTSVTIPTNVTTLGQNAFANCNALSSVIIEDGATTLNMYSYTSNSNRSVFAGCPLTTLYIGRNIAPSNTFYSPFYNHLAAANLSVIFGSQVTAICDLLFYGTSSVKSVTIPESVTTIGAESFAGCGLTSLTIPNSVITVGTSAFANNSSLTSLSIGTKVTTINASAFSGCASLTSLTIPVNVTTLGQNAFANCNALSSVIIEDGATTLNMYSYTSNSNRSVFAGCPLTTLYIGRNIAPSNTFYSPFADDLAAANLAVTFGSQVTTVPAQLFNGTTTITQITSKAVVPPTAGTNCFQGVNKTTCKLYVPETALDAYKSANEWKDFFNIYAGINDISTSPISVYPNPVRADLFIKSETPVEKIEIYSLSGNLLLTNYFTDKISVSALPKGVLFVKVYTNQGTVIKKIVKE